MKNFITDVDCGDIGLLEHGSVTLKDNRTSYKSVAQYSCEKNYTLVGEKERICGEHSIWTGKQPQCLCDYIQVLRDQ